MSDGIEIKDGKASFAYAGEPAWHRLGKQVSNDLTPAQMQKESGSDFGVQLCEQSYYWRGPNDKTPRAYKSGKSALVRTDTGECLDTVPNNWKPVQNDDAFAFFNDFVKAGEMEMHTAGVLGRGERVWALAKLKSGFSLFKGDEVEGYLLFSNPHMYGKTLEIMFTPVRVVCQNTLAMALNAKEADNRFRQTHRVGFDPDLAKRYIGISDEKMAKYKEMAEFLGSQKADIADIKNYLSDVFPTTAKKKVDELSLPARRTLDALDTQQGADFAKGSWWQAINAVTFHIDHTEGDDDVRLNSIWFGREAAIKNKALELAVQYAKNSKGLIVPKAKKVLTAA